MGDRFVVIFADEFRVSLHIVMVVHDIFVVLLNTKWPEWLRLTMESSANIRWDWCWYFQFWCLCANMWRQLRRSEVILGTCLDILSDIQLLLNVFGPCGYRDGDQFAWSAPPLSSLGPVLLTLLRHVARILANGSAAFFESCDAIGWNSCDVSQKR